MVDLHSESVDRLFEAILKLETIDDCYRFFEDVCTIKEIRDISQRLYIASLLNQGMNYQSIARMVDASSATISRVSKCLNYGSGGYREALDKLHPMEDRA
ncbi:MAG: helix-turn-helix domain-containing protein [Clostridia bacterium]|nr:helix-turn-helix domain-containing protein [Clostridia bacterium]